MMKSVSDDQILKSNTNASEGSLSNKQIAKILDLQKSWQEKCKKAPTHFSNFCRASVELTIVSRAVDNDYVKKDKQIKDNIEQVIKNCIEEERRDITLIVEELRCVYTEIQKTCSKVLEELNKVQRSRPFSDVTQSSETSMSIVDLIEMWSDIERTTLNEYIIKKFILEHYLDSHNFNEEPINNMWKDSSDWNKICETVSFLNKHIQ